MSKVEKCHECGAERSVHQDSQKRGGMPYRTIGHFSMDDVMAGREPCEACFAWLHEFGGLDAPDAKGGD